MARAPNPVRTLALIFAISGCAGLFYEVVWARAFAQVAGQSLHALTAVMVAFLGGLAIGAGLGGRLGGRVASPLRVYALLEIWIALHALLSSALFVHLDSAFETLGPWFDDGLPIAGLRLAITLIVLLPSTLAMGATFPLLVREAVGRGGHPERAISILYGCNTVGAACGALLGSFASLPLLGTRRTIYAAALLNLAAAAIAWIVCRRASMPFGAGVATEPPADTDREAVHEARPRTGHRFILVAVASLSGAVGAVLQTGWVRVITLTFGSSVYALGLTLTAYILGLGLGPLAATRLRPLQRLTSAGRAASAQWLVGSTSLLLLPCLGMLPGMAAAISGRFGHHPLMLMGLQFLLVAAMLLLPAMAQGAAFPPLAILWGSRVDRVHGAAGTIYAWSTCGSVGGFLLAGFVAVPALGTRPALTLASIGALLLCAALLLFTRGAEAAQSTWMFPPRRQALSKLMLGVLVPAPLLLLALPSWDREAMSGGGFLYGPVYRAALGEHRLSEAIRLRGEILYYREGGEGLVTVRRSRAGVMSLQINGKTEASSGGDMATQLLTAHLPLLAHPAPRDVLVIGLASGVSLGAAERHPVGSIRVVEIVPAVVEAARLFDEHNGSALDDHRADIVVDDARSHLLARPARYDVIASQPSNPWVAGVANLFTVDFYRTVERRLRPGGIFCQWVQAYRLEPRDLQGIVRSFLEVFPEGTLWEESAGGGDYFLLGGDSPLRIDPERLATAPDQVWQDLRRGGIHGPADLLSRFVAGPRELAMYAEAAVPHTDDNLYLEWRAPLALFRDTLRAQLIGLNRYRTPVVSILTDDPLGRHAAIMEELGLRLRQRQERLAVAESLKDADLDALWDPHLAAGIDALRSGLFMQAIAPLSRAAAENPLSATAHLLLGEAYRGAGLDEAAVVAFLEAVRRDADLAPAWNALGQYHAKNGRLQEARHAFSEAVRSDPTMAVAHNNLGATYLLAGDLEDAERSLVKAMEADAGLAAARANLGLVLKRRGDLGGAERMARAALELDPLNLDARFNLATILRETDRVGGARRELEELLRIDPGDRAARDLLRDIEDGAQRPEAQIGSGGEQRALIRSIS